MDDRLTDLEVRYSYLERVVGELDAVAIELRGEIERLTRELKELRAVLTNAPPDDAPPADEKPPHY